MTSTPVPFRLYLNDGTGLVATLRSTSGYAPDGVLNITGPGGLVVTGVIADDVATFTWTALYASGWAHDTPLQLTYDDPTDARPLARVIGEGVVLRNVGQPGLSLSSLDVTALLVAGDTVADVSYEGAATEDAVRAVEADVEAVKTAVDANTAVATGVRTATQQTKTAVDATKAAVDAGNLTLASIDAHVQETTAKVADVETAVLGLGTVGGGDSTATVAAVDALGPKIDATTAQVAVVDTTLGLILTELGAKLEAGQAIALDTATLAALEQITVSGTVALDPATLTALETVTAAVTGTVALDATTLAALETITAVISGPVALDAPTLAALENVTAAVTGTVALDTATLAALEQITVSGTVALDTATLAALENITAVVSGTVALDAPTLTALDPNPGATTVAAAVADTTTAVGEVETAVAAADVAARDAAAGQSAYLANRYGGGKQSYAALVSTAGTTTLVTPAAGKALEVYWVYALANPTSETAALITLTLGDPIYVGYAISHWEKFVGPVNAPLTVTLGASVGVAVTIHYREVTP